MTYLLQVSTCWIVFYGIYLLFLQKETFFTINRYYLLSALFAGLMIPFLGEFLPANNTSTEIYQVMTQVSTIEITSQQEQMTSSFNWISLLYWTYAIGVLIVFSRFLYGLSRIYNLYNGASKTKYKNYTLVEPSTYHLPFSFFHFIFISKKLPLNKDVEKVLKHEELHANQWHSLDIVITELLQVFFWFNPILIFYKSALKQSHEFLADAYVTQDHNRSSYGQLLLRQSTSGLEIALANHFFHSQIKKRITMLYKEKSKRPAMVKYLAAIPVLAAMLFIFSSSKMDNQNTESNNDCTSMQIEDNYKYTIEGQQISLSEFEAKINGDNSPKCISLHIKHSALFNSINPVLEAASKAKVEVQLFKDDLDEKDIMSEKDFNGRKIISRANVFNILPNKTLSGVITINAEADKHGNIISAEVSNEETTLKDKDLLLNVLRIVKTNKIEKGEGNVKGQFIYKIDRKKQADYTYSTKDNEFKLENTESQGDPVFKVVEEMPRFPGCEGIEGSAKEKEQCAKEKMLQFIYKNITYPASARNEKTEGMTVIRFIVEKDGKISSGEILRDIGSGCGDESLKVVNSMPTWIPGKQKGKAVRVQYTLPVKFKLESKTSRDKDISDEQKNFMANVTAFGKKSEKAKKENLVMPSSAFKDKNPNGGEIFKVVEEMPRFPGCENSEMSLEEKSDCAKMKMLEFIYKNIKYPKDAREKGIEGVAVVQILIEKDGSVSSSKVIRDPGAGTGAEAKRVIDQMPNWIPGKQQGKLVRVQYILPVKYKLEGGGSHEIKNGSLTLEKSNFIELEQLSSLFKTVGLTSECKVEKYRFVHVPKGSNAFISPAKQDKFNEDTKKIVQNAHEGDRYFIEDLYCQCPGDKEAKHYGGISIKIISDKNTLEIGYETDVDQKPLFPNSSTESESQEKLLNFVFKNVIYPKNAVQNNIEGLAIIKFIINTNGHIQNTRIVKSPGWGINEVIEKLIAKMQKIEIPWTPATIDNKNVNFEYVLPVKFKLEDNQIEEAKSRKLDMQDFSISPNPSNGLFTLAFSLEDKTPSDIIFYSINGQILKTIKKVNVPFNQVIDLSNFNSQTIFMNIVQKDKVYSDKIIVK